MMSRRQALRLLLGSAGALSLVQCSSSDNNPRRVGGFPVMSLLGIIASVIVCWAFYRLLIDNTCSLNLKFSNWGMILGLVFALVWFYAWKAYRKRQGVNLDRRYAEIPIE